MLSTRRAWRLTNNPNHLWVQLLKGKCFAKTRVLHKYISKNTSWVCDSIRQGIEVVRRFSIWSVSSNFWVKILTDKWLPEGSTVIIIRNLPNPPTLVRELIDHQTVNTTRSVDIKKETESGLFTSKSVYALISRNHHRTDSWFWKKNWKVKVIPTCLCGYFLLIFYLLMLKLHLLHLNISCIICILCNSSVPETSSHLFINCPFVRAVWFTLAITCPPIDGSGSLGISGIRWFVYRLCFYMEIQK